MIDPIYAFAHDWGTLPIPAGEQASTARHIVLPAHLAVRGSCGAAEAFSTI
jgi:hypothetical protein